MKYDNNLLTKKKAKKGFTLTLFHATISTPE